MSIEFKIIILNEKFIDKFVNIKKNIESNRDDSYDLNICQSLVPRDYNIKFTTISAPVSNICKYIHAPNKFAP